MKRVFGSLKDSGVRFTINTDGPEMLRTNLRGEIEFLLDNGVLKVSDVLDANRNAFAASFVK